MSKKKIVFLVLPVFVVLGVLLGWNQYTNHQNNLKIQAAQKAAEKTIATAPKTYITYKGVMGKTALELLKTKHKVVTKTYSFGEQVISIDGLVGNGPKYWTFYINGKMADVGAGAYQTIVSDTIAWKWEQL